MLLFFVVALILGALSAWWRPWVGGSAGSYQLLNAGLGALTGAGVAALLGSLVRRALRDRQEGLKRCWQALLLGALGALVSGGLLAAALLLFGRHSAVLGVGGVMVALATLAGLWVGAGGVLEWRRLWAPPEHASSGVEAKLLDTSVIIDGRIGGLVETGFIEGKLILPHFVLQELHAVADSQDPLRRRKGRRGLDILGELQHSTHVQWETSEQDFPQVRDVDHKLIELAKVLGAELLTTDYNLNKVAKVEGIKVLNVNELANAVKPRYLPGEVFTVEVVGRGEGVSQGIGYLDDGTMVVVENGRSSIGKEVRVSVSSTLQTDAGKMLFVRLKGDNRNSRSGS